MSNVLQNDFTAGIISPKLIGKYNSSIYQNSCLNLVNFSILPQGGITRRPGTDLKNNPSHTQSDAQGPLKGSRLIPFGISENENYVLEFGSSNVTEFVRVWTQDCSELMVIYINGSGYTQITSALLGFSLYTASECEQIQFAQDYERLYIAHRNHKPLVVKRVIKTINSTPTVQLEFSQLTPTLQTNDTDNTGLFTGDDCPGVVMYYASRLWFASSNNHPYRVWASRPFVYNNFEFWDVEEVVDDGVTSETIENAVKYGELSWTSNGITADINADTWKQKGLPSNNSENPAYIFAYTGSAWTLNSTVVTLSEYGITITGVPVSGNSITVQYYNIDEISYSEENVYREDSALLLEVGSSRNDTILWMNSMNNYIVVGTTGGEWMMNGAINGLSQNIYQSSAYGSKAIQAVQAGNDLVFVQNDKKVRAYVGSSDGFASPDLTFYTFVASKIKRMAWQRIPDPRLYCLMEDGTLMVCHYDRQYSLQGWALWSYGGRVKDICVAESSKGQTAYISIERDIDASTTRLNLEAFTEVDVSDNVTISDCKYTSGQTVMKTDFESTMLTNCYDTSISGRGSTMGNFKRIYRAILRVLNCTTLKVGYSFALHKNLDNRYIQTKTPDTSYGIDDMEVTIPGGSEKFISVGIKVDNSSNATILALSFNTEVS